MTGEHRNTIREVDKDSWEGVFYFHPDDAIYLDHFPGNSVVPGSLIIHAFLKAREEAGFSGGVVTVENFRFREFLHPGHYHFRVELRGNRLHCAIIHEGKTLTTGILKG
jgi:3-hydroxyacyl-[acyl-carrier-protein] dehydratase